MPFRTATTFRSCRGPLKHSFLGSLSCLLAAFLLAPNLSPRGEVLNPAVKLPESLDPLVRRYPPRVEAALRALKQGVEEYKARRFSRALALLPADAAANETAVADIALLYRAKSNLALEKPQQALNEFRLLQSRYPNSPQLTEAILGESQALLRLKDPQTALALLRNPNLPVNAETLFMRARAHEEAGNQSEALELFLKVHSDFATSDAAARVVERLQKLTAKSPSVGSRFLMQRAENLVRAGKNREARTLLLRMTGNLQGREEKRALLLAEAEFNLGRTTSALSYLKKVTNLDPSTHARALYQLGAVYRRLDKPESLLEIQDSMLRLYPESPFTERLLYSVATFFELDQQPKQAQEAYRIIAERFPNGEHAQRARWKMALYYYADRNYDDALHGFWQYLRAFPQAGSASPPIFWMGRCYEKLGNSQRALFLYEHARTLANDSYYGLRSDEALAALKPGSAPSLPPYEGLDFQEVTRFVAGLRLPQPAISAPPPLIAQSLERARQLVAADQPELALTELRGLERRFPNEKSLNFLMSRIYEKNEDFYGVIVSLRRAFPDYSDQPANSLPEEVWQLLFPVRHWETISVQAKKNNLAPALVLGLIRQESAFRPTARSTQNARGLMQVLPRTGRSLARKAGVARYSVRKLFQPEANIAIGTRHLFMLLQQYDHKMELALAAYNAGGGRVDLWLKQFGNVEMTEFVERIPFAETRGYVKQVLTNEAHYRRLAAALSIPSP